ncbi:hypothetical protein FRB95_000247 [Tulasnella sp. JGI-2019a]|nr:hypothetical protein FRB95_000247 [Tulasnella sp. JGI-2019a]
MLAKTLQPPSADVTAAPADDVKALHSEATNPSSLKTIAIQALFSELEEKRYTHWCPTPETQELTMRKRAALSKAAGEDILVARTVHDI